MTAARVVPALAFIALAAAALIFRPDRYLTLDTLRDNRAFLLGYVGAHPVLSGACFILAYTASVALSLPGATIMTVAGGFLFGAPLGAAQSVAGATMGAILLFAVARSAIGDALRERAGPYFMRTADGFRKDAFNYLLFLRLTPAFPFWAVNLAAAFLGVPPRPYVIATLIGIVPCTVAYAAFGAGLGKVFDAGGDVRPSDVFNPPLIGALACLALLAVLPIALRRYRETRSQL